MTDLQGLRKVNQRAADVNFSALHRTEHNAEASTQASGIPVAQRRSGSSSRSDLPQRRPPKAGGFLLEPAFANGHAQGPKVNGRIGKRSEVNGQIYNGKRQAAARRESVDSSRRGSPLSREVSMDEIRNGSLDANLLTRPYAPGIDPVNLVQVALQLNESRKRHVSNTISLQQSSLAPSKQASPNSQAGQSFGKRTPSSTKRNTLPGDYLPSPSPSPLPGTSSRPNSGYQDDLVASSDRPYTFSPATLSRAEKARRYFELASEHRRLLEHLPPMKIDSESQHAAAPDRSRHSRFPSTPGKAHSSDSQELGRPYNPLQALRNRRIRAREKRQLAPPPESFQEIDRIKSWIDDVKAVYSFASGGENENVVSIPPPFAGEVEEDEKSPGGKARKQHRRTETTATVITRPENDWSVEPAELLADTYWTERGDNRLLLEDRRGRRLFRGRRPMSAESDQFASGPAQLDGGGQSRRSFDESEDEDIKIRHRKRNMIPIPKGLRRNGLPYMNRSPSTTSLSSAEGRNVGPKEFSTGPLERHMREMIEKDERGEIVPASPESQHHWDVNHFSSSLLQKHRSHHHGRHSTNGHLSIDTSQHRRAESADGRPLLREDSLENERPAVHGAETDSPASPLPAELAPVGRAQTPLGTSHKRSSSFGPQTSSSVRPPASTRPMSQDLDRVGRTDFAQGFGSQLSPVLSADTPRSVASASRLAKGDRKDLEPSANRNKLFKSGRLAELMRNESSRLGERLRGKPGNRSTEAFSLMDSSRAASDASDVEDDAPSDYPRSRHAELVDGESPNNTGLSARNSFEQNTSGQGKARYRIPNLPSFKSPSTARERRFGRTPTEEIGDPFSRLTNPQQRHSSGVGDRLGRKPPPQIRIPDEDSASSSDAAARELSQRQSQPQQNLSPRFSQFGRRSQPPSRGNSNSEVPTLKSRFGSQQPGTGVAALRPGNHKLQRHWSISDHSTPRNPASHLQQTQKARKAQQQMSQLKDAHSHLITTHDIARIRALLLASGIKAHEIISKADRVRDPPLKVIATAAQTPRPDGCDDSLPDPTSVPRKREAIVAARLLSATIDSSCSSFDASLQSFQNSTLPDLVARISTLRDHASEHLAKAVAETSEAADAFNVELTTAQPQAVKRVDDAVDALLRRRNRKFRWVRRAGFKVLEWTMLSVMWWVWFIVVVVNLFRKVSWGVLRGARWLLWF